MSNLQLELYKALRFSLEAEKQEALVKLQLGLSNSVAVGEHLDILSDIKGAVRELVDADLALAVLTKYTASPEAPAEAPAQEPVEKENE